jgi:membrane protein implicated in regulation of membrane protease activity
LGALAGLFATAGLGAAAFLALGTAAFAVLVLAALAGLFATAGLDLVAFPALGVLGAAVAFDMVQAPEKDPRGSVSNKFQQATKRNAHPIRAGPK